MGRAPSSETLYATKYPEGETTHSIFIEFNQIKNMRIFIIVFLTLSFQSLGQDSMNIVLQRRIYDVFILDQECREQHRKYQNNELDTSLFKLSIIDAKIKETDSLNYFELKSILDTFGFPGFNLVGEDYSNSFWNIIQHQDNNLEFQKFALDKMKKEVDRNNASKLYFAYLIDRVKINSGEEQIYGTQMQLNSDSTSYEPKPVIDQENLDKRRAEVGLIPISEYIDTMNKRYFGNLKEN